MNSGYGTRLDDYGFERYEENSFPIAYLLTWRTFGTWLHGDERSSIQRGRDKRFGPVRMDGNVPLEESMGQAAKQEAVILTRQQRKCVDESVRATCEYRMFRLVAANIRSNHGHAVIRAAARPEKIVNDIKAYSTRALRNAGLIGVDQKVWARGASTRYLWKPASVEAAIEYVLYSQDDVPFGAVVEMSED